MRVSLLFKVECVCGKSSRDWIMWEWEGWKGSAKSSYRVRR